MDRPTRVPILPRRHLPQRHSHRPIRVFRVDRRPIVIPPPSRLPWPDAITAISIEGGNLVVEYGS